MEELAKLLDYLDPQAIALVILATSGIKRLVPPAHRDAWGPFIALTVCAPIGGLVSVVDTANPNGLVSVSWQYFTLKALWSGFAAIFVYEKGLEPLLVWSGMKSPNVEAAVKKAVEAHQIARENRKAGDPPIPPLPPLPPAGAAA